MINPQWLELPMSRTNFHGPKDVRAIEVRLYFHEDNEDSDQTAEAQVDLRLCGARMTEDTFSHVTDHCIIIVRQVRQSEQ